jgi:hypothetical protein
MNVMVGEGGRNTHVWATYLTQWGMLRTAVNVNALLFTHILLLE